MYYLAFALRNYHEQHGRMPPAGETSKPLSEVSWRVAVLPYAEQQPLYSIYRQDLPWDSQQNMSLVRKHFLGSMFQHPAHRNEDPLSTNIVAVVGPGTLWPPEGPLSFEDIEDGLDKTVILVEVAHSDTLWHEPRDIHIDEVSFEGGPGLKRIGGHRRGGAYVVFADNHVRFLPDTTSPKELRSLLTIDGGESLDVTTLKP